MLYDDDDDDDDDVLYDDDVACSLRMRNDITELLNAMIWSHSKSDLFLIHHPHSHHDHH